MPRLQELRQGGGAARYVLELASTLVPALPLSTEASFEPGTKVMRVPGEPDLYRMRQPGMLDVLPPGLRRPDLPPEAFEGFAPQELVFGLIGDVWVTAPNVRIARQAAAEEPREDPALPGAIAGRAPLEAADFAFEAAEGGGVTLTVLDLGIEATAESVRLRLEAGL